MIKTFICIQPVSTDLCLGLKLKYIPRYDLFIRKLWKREKKDLQNAKNFAFSMIK